MSFESVESLNAKLILFTIIGLGLSVYAFLVENKLELDKNYEPMCDIHEYVSCSKAFESEYGKGFGLISSESVFYKPNSFYGILHYSMIVGLSIINRAFITTTLFILTILASLSSVYFAYILYFILYDFCIICVGTYVVNAFLLYFAYNKYKLVNSGYVNVDKIK